MGGKIVAEGKPSELGGSQKDVTSITFQTHPEASLPPALEQDSIRNGGDVTIRTKRPSPSTP